MGSTLVCRKKFLWMRGMVVGFPFSTVGPQTSMARCLIFGLAGKGRTSAAMISRKGTVKRLPIRRHLPGSSMQTSWGLNPSTPPALSTK